VRTEWDVLPLVLELPGQEPFIFEWPKESVHQCMIEHPTNEKFNALALRWYAVPTISNFNMRIGGIDYVCCPFNGWYADIEIGRDLWDRYQKAEPIARAFELDTTTDHSMWRDAGFCELNRAIAQSFKRDRFTLDRFTCSRQFMTHVERVRKLGREVPSQWSWLGGLGDKVLCITLSNDELLDMDAAKEGRSTRRIVFDIAGTGLSYATGDHLVVHPINPPELVERLCRAIDVSPQSSFAAFMNDNGTYYPL